MKAEDFKAIFVAEDYINYVKSHPGKLTGKDKYILKGYLRDAVREVDAHLVRVIRTYIETH